MAELKLISYDTSGQSIKQPTASDYTSTTGNFSVGSVSFDDVLMTELSIPNVQLQTDTNAFTFSCPYNMDLTGLQLFLDNHGTSGNVTVTVSLVGGSTLITLSVPTTDTGASTTLGTPSSIDIGDDIRFAITATPTTNTNGLRANLLFRRRIV